MNTIKINGKELSLNKLVLRLFLKGVKIVKPKYILSNFVSIRNKDIIIKNNSNKTLYKNIKKIIPICVGKAAVESAITIQKIFKDSQLNLDKGIVVVNEENFKRVKNFKCFKAGHPLPNEESLKASNEIITLLKNTDKNDLVLVLISGGGSALLSLPVNSISLKEKIIVNKLLLNSGANINEINTVRKHLSKIKGGNFTKECFPAKTHSLILSDVIGDDLSSIASGLTVPDPSTFFDAKKILNKYDLWKKIPKSVNSYIKDGMKNSFMETPKPNDIIFRNSKETIIGSNSISVNEIKKYCERINIESLIWKKDLHGDVKEKAKELVDEIRNKRFKSPIIIVSGGETTVKIQGDGKGGRNQEFALYFCLFAKKKLPNIKYTFLSAGTDGKDGPTDAAGGVIDQNSFNKIKKMGLNLERELFNNNSYHVLQVINSLVIINGTNTNVADIQILAIK